MIKAIETVYKGYRFRSRLEARWAVFFDALGIEWEYEKEGYDLDGIRYLPDFWLCKQRYWLEIKPGEPSADEVRKAEAFQKSLYGQPEIDGVFHILAGSPYMNEYKVLPSTGKDARMAWVQCPLCKTLSIAHCEHDFSSVNFRGMDMPTGAIYCVHCDVIDRNWKETDSEWFHKGWVEFIMPFRVLMTPLLLSAYTAARSARFEHGERPKF